MKAVFLLNTGKPYDVSISPYVCLPQNMVSRDMYHQVHYAVAG